MIVFLKDAIFVENIVLKSKKISIVIVGTVLEKILANIKNKVLETGGILYGFKIKENDEKSVIFKENTRRIGSLEGQDLIDADYDIDECNDEIAEMFKVNNI